MSKVVDYTQARLGGLIGRCPKCGRKAQVRRYADGSAQCVHVKVLRGWYWDVTDNCMIPRINTEEVRMSREAPDGD